MNYILTDTALNIIDETLVMMQCKTSLQARIHDRRIRELIQDDLEAHQDYSLEGALSHLQMQDALAYEQLLTIAEDCCSFVSDKRGVTVLTMIPILTWSRYQNFQGPVDDGILQQIADLMRGTIVTDKASVVIGSHVISMDNLPDSFARARWLIDEMRELDHGCVYDLTKLVKNLPPHEFADARFLLCTVSAPTIDDLYFTDNHGIIEVGRGMMNFCKKTHELLELPLVGSVFEVMPPGAYYATWREVELMEHSWGIESLVDFACAMGFKPEDLIASIGLFVPGPRDADKSSELRVGLSTRQDPENIFSGICWQVTDEEVDSSIATIQDILNNKKISKVVNHEQPFTLEWCEDCGEALYPTPGGLVVHINVPNINPSQMTPTLN